MEIDFELYDFELHEWKPFENINNNSSFVNTEGGENDR